MSSVAKIVIFTGYAIPLTAERPGLLYLMPLLSFGKDINRQNALQQMKKLFENKNALKKFIFAKYHQGKTTIL